MVSTMLPDADIGALSHAYLPLLSAFFQMHGVVRVVAGYTGGVQPYPCREDLKDHTEALMIEYDPRIVSYRGILEM